MTHIIEKVAGEPAILFKMASGSYESAVPDPPAAARSFALLEAQPEPVFYIVDLLDAEIKFSGMMAYANSQSFQMASRHPKVRQLIVLTKDPALQLAVQGLNSEAFGYVEAPVFETMDEAIVYIREHK